MKLLKLIHQISIKTEMACTFCITIFAYLNITFIRSWSISLWRGSFIHRSNWFVGSDNFANISCDSGMYGSSVLHFYAWLFSRDDCNLINRINMCWSIWLFDFLECRCRSGFDGNNDYVHWFIGRLSSSYHFSLPSYWIESGSDSSERTTCTFLQCHWFSTASVQFLNSVLCLNSITCSQLYEWSIYKSGSGSNLTGNSSCTNRCSSCPLRILKHLSVFLICKGL